MKNALPMRQTALSLHSTLFSHSRKGADDPSSLLFKWNHLLNRFIPCLTDKGKPTQDEIDKHVSEWHEENMILRAKLIEASVDYKSPDDKANLVRMYQTMVTRLLDKLHEISQLEAHGSHLKIFHSLANHLQETLHFIKEFLGPYFDWEQHLPLTDFQLVKSDWGKMLSEIENIFLKSENIDQDLGKILLSHLQTILITDSGRLTYNQVAYYDELFLYLRNEKNLTTQKIRAQLYYSNFNEEQFAEYEFEQLRQLVQNFDSAKQKVAYLRLEQKKVNQWPTKLDCGLTKEHFPVKEQVNRWIDEEVKFLEGGHSLHVTDPSCHTASDKIQTSLSVAKLAVIVRLLVIDKIIINRTIAPMLRIVAKLFTTLQRDEISFVSLEAKYHAPEKATVSAVRDMLFKWIKILDKL